jgi:hypothetical protein
MREFPAANQNRWEGQIATPGFEVAWWKAETNFPNELDNADGETVRSLPHPGRLFGKFSKLKHGE